jgi:geranylgeranyl diphosphate synthase type II
VADLAGALSAYLHGLGERLGPQLQAAVARLEHAYTPELLEAVQYTLLAGGKRVRPAVVELWAQSVGRPRPAEVMAAAMAAELIHTSSLVLDDLPSMDDARTRRGRPCCHVRFGVDTAILAANAQLMLAFELLGGLDAGHGGLGATALLADAVGVRGMIGGQHVDLRLPAQQRDLVRLEYIHSHKTGALFVACARLGARLGEASAGEEELAAHYARNLGLAFQIKDDLLDATGHAAEMGKDARQDRGKPTFVACLGYAESEEIMRRLLDTARAALDRLPAASAHLRSLCDYLAARRS